MTPRLDLVYLSTTKACFGYTDKKRTEKGRKIKDILRTTTQRGGREGGSEAERQLANSVEVVAALQRCK